VSARDRRLPIMSAPVLLAAGIFLAVLGTRLGLIRGAGSDLPYLDQWFEAIAGYIPYLAGDLHLSGLFAAHGEHRPFFGTAIALGLLILNGQWDPILQMTVSAVFWSAAGSLLFLALLRDDGGDRLVLWTGLVLLVFLVPFGWENTVRAAHASYYYLTAFSLAMIAFLPGSRPFSPRWIAGCLAGICAIFTMAPGLLAPVTVLALAALDAARDGRKWGKTLGKEAVTLAFCAAVVTAGLALKPHPEVNRALAANAPTDFLAALGRNLSWPIYTAPVWSLVNWMPFAALVVAYARDQVVATPAVRLTVGIGLWALLMGAATAYARGAGAPFLPHRYLDSICFGTLANAAALVFIRDVVWGRYGFVIRRLPPLWIAVNVVALAFLTARGVMVELPAGGRMLTDMGFRVAGYVATGDRKLLDGGDAPFPDRGRLLEMIRVLDGYGVLPAGIRKPVHVSQSAGSDPGWRKNRCPAGLALGTATFCNTTGKGAFAGEVVRKSRLPWLKFWIFRSEGEPLLLSVSDGKGVKNPLRAGRPDREGEWAPGYMRFSGLRGGILAVPGGVGVFGFSEPREMGRLSYYAVVLVGNWLPVLAAGLALLAAGLARVVKEQ